MRYHILYLLITASYGNDCARGIGPFKAIWAVNGLIYLGGGGGGGGTLIFFSHVGLDPASTVYPPKISGIPGIPQNI